GVIALEAHFRSSIDRRHYRDSIWIDECKTNFFLPLLHALKAQFNRQRAMRMRDRFGECVQAIKRTQNVQFTSSIYCRCIAQGENLNFHCCDYAIRTERSSIKSEIFTRSCFIESRSRSVTVSCNAASFSPSVSKSTVIPNGVPISSCRR